MVWIAYAIYGRHVTDEPLDESTLVAVNKTYAGPDHAITDGDEVAFFPPITGG